MTRLIQQAFLFPSGVDMDEKRKGLTHKTKFYIATYFASFTVRERKQKAKILNKIICILLQAPLIKISLLPFTSITNNLLNVLNQNSLPNKHKKKATSKCQAL